MTTSKDSKAIAARLKKEWNDDDLRAFADADTDEPLLLLKQAEKWLTTHAHDAVLLLTCARLAIRSELYGKARRYLEASLVEQAQFETYLLLAHLLEQLDDSERAYKLLKTAVAQAVGRKIALPKIRVTRLERRRIDRRKG
jgi:HemY protein